jgi:glutamine amidotransferase
MKVTIIDYGVGNLHSISKAFEHAGAEVEVSGDPALLLTSECMVFPGVGAFGAAARTLQPIMPSLRSRIAGGVPVLGVCLGMQLLFERSAESPGDGVGALSGAVDRLKAPRVPHMGWNEVDAMDDQLFEGVPPRSMFYFANSYVCKPIESVGVAETIYGERFVSAVRRGAVCGVQFHPEKSGEPGLKVIRNFVKIAERST